MSSIYTTADKFIFDPLSQCILFNVRNAYITIQFHKLRYKATQYNKRIKTSICYIIIYIYTINI